ncbi:hypothetical protein GGH95_000797 [Coemansia sp. RSA 1836]|nr:hypothetical protein GGH95_000797 [Coemansia sp. RSA 1836]
MSLTQIKLVLTANDHEYAVFRNEPTIELVDIEAEISLICKAIGNNYFGGSVVQLRFYSLIMLYDKTLQDYGVSEGDIIEAIHAYDIIDPFEQVYRTE